MGLMMGFPAENMPVKPRLPETVTIHHNPYNDDRMEAGIAVYDQMMDAGGVYAGRQVAAQPAAGAEGKPYGWSEHTARRLSGANPQRGNMRQVLEKLGFSFE